MLRSAHPLKTIDNALSVLEAFDLEHPEQGIGDLSERLGLNKSTVFRVVHTLAARGYLEQVESSRKFRLGLRSFEIGSRAVNQMGLGSLIQPVLDRLAVDCGNTVNLWVLSGRDVVLVNNVVPRQLLRLDVQTGARLPAHASAPGKVLLAYLPAQRLEGLLAQGPLRRCTEATICDPDALKEELLRIRMQGYGRDCDESFEGITCVASPVWDRRQQVIAAISVGMRSAVVGSMVQQETLAGTVVTAANRASAVICSLCPSDGATSVALDIY